MTTRRNRAVILMSLCGLIVGVPHKAFADTGTLKITGLHVIEGSVPPSDVPQQPALNTRLVLDVAGLPEWMKDGDDHDLSKVTVFLNGQPIPHLTPLIDRQTSQVTFDLTRDDSAESKAAWAFILGSPKMQRSRKVTVALGFADGARLTDDYKNVEFSIYELGWRFWLAGGVFVLAVVAFALLMTRTDILRDTISTNVAGARPFSLGRSQMAFWFFLSVGGYLLIWLITGDWNAMPSSVLGLIGISATTALGATAIDYTKSESGATESQSLIAEAQTLDTRLGQLSANPSLSTEEQRELAEKSSRRDAVNKRLRTLTHKVSGIRSDGFINDILKDGDGISLHRFQIVVWTLILGIVFCYEVYKNLAMPDFSNTLLALMGISAGTYLGFKFPEGSSSTPKPTGE